MVAEPVFVDTNILVYASQSLRSGGPSALHQAATRLLIDYESRGLTLWINRQILREYLAVVTRPQSPSGSLPAAQAVVDVRYFAQRLQLAEDGSGVTAKLLELLRRVPTAGKQVHDANIVATMLVHGIVRLATFNVDDFRRFQPLVAIEPIP